MSRLMKIMTMPRRKQTSAMINQQTFLKDDTGKSRHPVSTSFSILAALVFLTMLCGVLFQAKWLMHFDQTIRNLVFSYQPSWWTSCVKIGTQLFNSRQVLIILVISVIILGFASSYRDASFMVATTISGVLINTMVKLLVRRPRPTDHVLMHYRSWSFPSGHSIAAMIVCSCLIIIIWRHLGPSVGRTLLTLLLSLIILFIGYSRIYVSAHYPSDVLGGWSLGFIITVISWHWFYGRISNQARQKIHQK